MATRILVPAFVIIFLQELTWNLQEIWYEAQMLLLFFDAIFLQKDESKFVFFPHPTQIQFPIFLILSSMNHLVGWDGPHIFEAETQLPGMSIRCRQPRRTITLNLTIIMAYMRREKTMRILCFWWISVMVSGRNFRNVRSGMENMRENPSGCNRLNMFCGGRWNARRIGKCSYSPWIAADGSQLSGHLSGWRDYPSFSTSYFTKSGQLRVRGDWLFCLNVVIRRARLPDFEERVGQSRFVPLLETKVGIVAEWPKTAGFEF